MKGVEYLVWHKQTSKINLKELVLYHIIPNILPIVSWKATISIIGNSKLQCMIITGFLISWKYIFIQMLSILIISILYKTGFNIKSNKCVVGPHKIKLIAIVLSEKL